VIVERFSQNLINTGIFKLYTAIGFVATLIFFIFNTELFTPLEIIFGTVLVTVGLKGLSNLMLSFVVASLSLDPKREEFDYKYNEDKISMLLNQLVTQDIDEMNKKVNNKEQENKENSDKIEDTKKESSVSNEVEMAS